MSEPKPTHVTIQRFDPSRDAAPRLQSYTVSLDEPTTVLNIFRLIQQQHDASLAFRDFDCYRGVCLACHVDIKGKKERSCSYVVSPGDELTITPLHDETVIRDLVTIPPDNDRVE